MAELKTAKITKKSLKSNITKFKEKVSQVIEEADLAQLQLFETKIVSFEKDLKSTFDTIFSHCEEKDEDEFIKEQENIQDTLDDINLAIKRKLSYTNSKEQVNSNEISIKGNFTNEIRLPKLSLPVFSGKLEEWIEFFDLFSASVHKNSSLSNAQKLQYLKSSCKADAFNIIHSIPISDDNYEIAWNLLVERYSNKKDLINSIIKKLISLPQTSESANSLLKFVDSVNECIRSLNVLEQKVTEFSDTLVVYLLVEKLDRNTRCWWERSLKKEDNGTVEQLTSFLKEHARTLLPNKPFQKELKRTLNTKVFTCTSESSSNCLLCKSNHNLLKCAQFLNLSVKKRFEFVKEKKLCFNCLSSIHISNSCKSNNTCKKCHKHHHTLLHFEKNDSVQNSQMAQNLSMNTSNKSLSVNAQAFIPAVDSQLMTDANRREFVSATNTLMCASKKYDKQIVLSTAIIYVKNKFGEFIPVRSLLDSGSQNNFMTRECMQLLNLKPNKISASVSGLNNMTIKLKENVVTTIANSSRSFMQHLDFYIVPKISRITPTNKLNIPNSELLKTINLADPECLRPGPIHILLSNEIFFDLLKSNKIKMQNLILQETVFGYVASGYTFMPQSINSDNYCGIVQSVEGLTDIVKQFWEVEGVNENKKVKSQEEEYCEEHFLRTHSRRQDGRYVVEMPIKTDGLALLGDSKEIANKKLNFLVKRLAQNLKMKTLYEEFIHEYNKLGHSEIVFDENNPSHVYYLPHHGVYRPEKSSTVLRVVFNGSENTSSGVSLNDILLNGGIVQDDLFDIICRFRLFKFAFTADITKMYRQILIKEEQRDLLRILWKGSENESIKIYRLKTITYGTSNAPYLATRTLNQLAEDEKENFPLAAKVARKDFYVDDVLSGAQTLEEAQELQSQLKKLLACGGMVLHKWRANHSELFQDTIQEYLFNSAAENQTIKTLGLLWNTNADCFSFKISVREPIIYTKRTVLSDIARIYDPLGLLGPGITKAKIFIQQLWLLKLDWSDPLPEKIINEWKAFVTTMQSINDLKIPRFVLNDTFSKIELHGFSDASEQAYGAVIYLRSISSFTASSKLLCSKSRVAPLKSLTVPRLELCAALDLRIGPLGPGLGAHNTGGGGARGRKKKQRHGSGYWYVGNYVLGKSYRVGM